MSDPILIDQVGVPLKPGGIFTKKDGSTIQIHPDNLKKDIKGRWLPGISGNMSGRTGGTRERINVQAKMLQIDCCPFTILGYIAMGDQISLKEVAPIPLGQRRSAATELCKYLAPQRKSVDIEAEVTSDDKGRTVVILPSNGRESRTELEKLIEDDKDSVYADYESIDD